MYYDECLGKAVRAWSDGNVEVSDTMAGEDGFAYGVFEDGATLTTDVPNVVLGFAKNVSREGRGPEENPKHNQRQNQHKW